MIEDPDIVLVVGDVHGNLSWMKLVFQHAYKSGADCILQLGDFGFWTEGWSTDKYLNGVEQEAREWDIPLYWLDGNHECVDKLTRAVTKRGFLSVGEIRPDDEVLSLDDNGISRWVTIEGVLRKPYKGIMHGARSTRGVDMLVTPGHRVVGRTTTNNAWKEIAGDRLGEETIRIPVTGTSPTVKADLDDDWIRLYAWCLTDSWQQQPYGYWRFSQRESAAARITGILDRIGLPYTTSTRYRAIAEICGKRLSGNEAETTVRISADASRKIPWKKGSPLENFVWQFSSQQMSVFLAELVFCDGSYHPAGKTAGVIYYSKDDRWATQLCALMTVHGYKVKLSDFRGGSDLRINFCEKNDFVLYRQGRLSGAADYCTVEYDDEVWCLSVETGRFFVERGGMIHLTGNCFARQHEFNDPENRPMTTHLPRGTRWSWWGKRFMALGGATSVDRHMRTENVSWWSGEELSEADIEHASRDDGTPVDVVFAHDCPTGVDIPGVGADWNTQVRGFWPDSMLYVASLHRDKVRRVYDATSPGLWIHGHYHRVYERFMGSTRFLGLDMDATTLDKNTMTLDPEKLDRLVR